MGDDRRDLPEYCDPVVFFDDWYSGRPRAWITMQGENWIVEKHPEGQWTTHHQPTEDEMQDMRKVLLNVRA